MKEHWHNVYVTETVSKVVEILRSHGIKVHYNPKPEDPEDANAFIEPNEGVISSCDRWRAHGNPMIANNTPEKAMACLQLLSSAVHFETLRTLTKNFNVVQDCHNC